MSEAVPGVGPSASRAVLGRGLLYTAGTAAPVLSNALVTPFVTRALGASEYGIVATGLVILQVGMIVAGLGLAAAITRHGILEASGVPGARSLVMRGAAASAVLCGLAALASPWTADWVGVQDSGAMALSLAAAGCFAVVVNVQSYLRVLDQPGRFVSLSLTSALGGPVLGLLLVATWDRSATAYLAGLVGGYAVAAAIGLVMTSRGGRSTHHRGDTRRALAIGVPTVPHQVALYLAGGILVLVASRAFDQTQAGRLQLAVLVGSAPGVLTASLNNAWAPVVYRTPQDQRGEVLEHTGRDIGVLTSLAAGFVAIGAPLLLAVVAPASYDPSSLTPAVAWVAAGTVLSVVYLCHVHLVFASGRSHGLALVTPFSLLVGTAAAVAAAELAGLTAIGLGMTVTYAVLAACTAALARLVSPTRWRWQALLPAVGLGATLCAVGGLLPVDPGGWLVVRGLLCTAAAALSGLVLLRILRR